jgi:hypothetical protein
MPAPVVVKIFALRGQNLACEKGTCVVFATIKLGSKHLTTDVVTSDTNAPEFTGLDQCSFNWDGTSGMPPVEFFVWRRDDVRRTHTFIGQAKVQLHPSLLNRKEQRALLTTRGQTDAKLLNAFGTLGYLFFVIDKEEPQTDDHPHHHVDEFVPPVQNRGVIVVEESINAFDNSNHSASGAASGRPLEPSSQSSHATPVYQSAAASHQQLPPADTAASAKSASHSQQLSHSLPNAASHQSKSTSFSRERLGNSTPPQPSTPLPEALSASQASHPSSSLVAKAGANAGGDVRQASHSAASVPQLYAPSQHEQQRPPSGSASPLAPTVQPSRETNAPPQHQPQSQPQQPAKSQPPTPKHDSPAASRSVADTHKQHSVPSLAAAGGQGGMRSSSSDRHDLVDTARPTEDVRSATRHPLQKEGSAGSIDFSPTIPRRTLVLDLHGASNLLGRDMGAPGDPFAVISGLTVDGEPIDLAQTDVRWTTNEPSWNRRFRMAALDPSVHAIEVLLFDYDEVGESDFLGRAVLPIDFNTEGAKKSVTVPLVSRDGAASRSDRNTLHREHRETFGELHFGYQMELNGAPPPMSRAAREKLEAPQAEETPSRESSVSRALRDRTNRNARSGAAVAMPQRRDGVVAREAPGEAFRARVRATVLSATGLPADAHAYVALAFGASGTTTRQCVDNAGQAMAVGNSGVCIMTFAADFVADSPLEPLAIEIRDARRGDVVIAQSGIRVDVRDIVKPKTLTVALASPDDPKSSGATVTLLLASEVLPANIPSRLDPHSILQFCVKKIDGLVPKSAEGVAPELRSNPPSFVRVTYLVNEIEYEYTSPAVVSHHGPGGEIVLFFEPPTIELGDSPDITVAAFIIDENDFDECVGVATIPFVRLAASPDVTLPLMPRTSASVSRGFRPAAVTGFVSISTRILPPRAVIRGNTKQQTEATAPTIVEVHVHQATGLNSHAGKGEVVARVVNTSNPTTTPDLVSEARPINNAVWGYGPEDALRFQSVGVPESIRITLWDSSSRVNAAFLGEYDCFLQIPTEPVIGRVVNADLRPRQDIHFYESDVQLMNQSPTGLGSIQFTVKTFSVREFEQKTREEVAAAGGGFTLHLQIAEVADTNKRAPYCIRAEVGGQTTTTHTEISSHPKFRYNMKFGLHYETEMLVLYLCERQENVAADVVIAEVSLPVQAPPANQSATDAQSSWLVMRRTIAGADTTAPKLQVRWRTVTQEPEVLPSRDHTHHHPAIREPKSQDDSLQSMLQHVTAAPHAHNRPVSGRRRSRDIAAAITPHPRDDVVRPQQDRSKPRHSTRTPPRTPNADGTLDALRDEIAALRLQLTTIKDFGGRESGNGLIESRPQSPAAPSFEVNVYVPSYARLLTYTGTTRSTALDALRFAARELGIPFDHHARQGYSLVRPGLVLNEETVLADALAEGETVFFVIDPQHVSVSAAPAAAPQSNAAASKPLVTPRHQMTTRHADASLSRPQHHQQPQHLSQPQPTYHQQHHAVPTPPNQPHYGGLSNFPRAPAAGATSSAVSSSAMKPTQASVYSHHSASRNQHLPPAEPHYTPPAPPKPDANAVVVQRLRDLAAQASPQKRVVGFGEPDTDIASIFVTFRGAGVTSATIEAAATYIVNSDLRGFARPRKEVGQYEHEDTEIFLQGAPALLAKTVEGIVDRARAWRFRTARLQVDSELVEGYIPVLQQNFFVAREEYEAELCFERGSTAHPGAECWFYHAKNFPFGTPHVRWIDEREGA